MSSDEETASVVGETFTCESCGKTFPKGWSDEEAAAEAEEFFPGINVSDPAEAGLVCDGCFEHIMARAHAEAPEMIGPGWRGAATGGEEKLTRFLAEECPECGTPGPLRHLSVVGGCRTCADNDPRPVFVFPAPRGWRSGGSCYRLASGAAVHVKPGCRC